MRYDYRKECKQMVDIRGIRCEYMDVRIDRDTVPPVKRTFLVQRKFPDGDVATSLMNEHQLISYINMDDCHDEEYELYDVTIFGKVTPCYYTGWQPGCLIEVADENGEILLSGYGEDH